MNCLKPRQVGWKEGGKHVSFSPKTHAREYPLFVLPCGKCIECRLSYAQSWAIRSVHESMMHERNSFITLTYENNPGKLKYEHFQKFAKRLRSANPELQIGYIVAGEYGEKTKRPHWHAIIFGWQPDDLVYKYSNDRGDKVYDSKTLHDLWGHGISEVGSVTVNSANYVARYSAKKLVHGNDQEHDFHPIFRASSKHAVGKKFLEKYYQDIFNYGELKYEGRQYSIPRYYEKWFKKEHPEEYERYLLEVKIKKMSDAERRDNKEKKFWKQQTMKRFSQGRCNLITRNEINKILSSERYNRLKKGALKC